MKRSLLALSVLAVSLASNAQAEGFTGFSIEGGLGYESMSPTTSSDITYNSMSIPSSYNIDSTKSLSGKVGFSYYFPVSSNFVLGYGADYYPIKSNSANAGITVMDTSNSLGSMKKSNTYNLYVSPGYKLGNDGLLYGKVGYTTANIDTSDTSTKFNGYSLGIGYKKMITGSIYGFGELNYSKYNDQTASSSGTADNGSPITVTMSNGFSTTNVLVGAGYKF